MRRTRDSKVVACVDGNGAGKLSEFSAAAERSAHEPERIPLSIALIDPKPLTRQSIFDALAKAFPDDVTVAVSSCEELLETGRKLVGGPPLVIIHVRSAGVADGWVQRTLELVRLRMPDAPVIVLSDRDDVADILKALTCGVRGYIPASFDIEVASAALRLVNAGGTFIPAHALRSSAAAPYAAAEGKLHGLPDMLDLLGPRELSVLSLLREGKPNKLIAIELNMQASTVKVHVRNIIKKLGATNRTHAVFLASRLLGQ